MASSAEARWRRNFQRWMSSAEGAVQADYQSRAFHLALGNKVQKLKLFSANSFFVFKKNPLFFLLDIILLSRRFILLLIAAVSSVAVVALGLGWPQGEEVSIHTPPPRHVVVPSSPACESLRTHRGVLGGGGDHPSQLVSQGSRHGREWCGWWQKREWNRDNFWSGFRVGCPQQ